jgi:hypothetical protein
MQEQKNGLLKNLLRFKNTLEIKMYPLNKQLRI